VTGGGLPASIWHEFMQRADEIKGGVAAGAAGPTPR
jgi:hypothetical protein